MRYAIHARSHLPHASREDRGWNSDPVSTQQRLDLQDKNIIRIFLFIF